MNKKIKIIELLNKIANGEEETLPKRIKYINYDWKIGKNENCDIDYITSHDNCVSNQLFGLYLNQILIECLSDEVEILEDNTEEIEELPINNEDEKLYSPVILANRIKINELVRIVNSIRKNIDKEYCCNCGVEITDENRALHNMCNECKYGIDWREKSK